MLRSLGSEDAMVSSACRFVVMYRFGSIGVPAAADIYTNDGTCSATDSCARVIAYNKSIYQT